MAELTMFHMDYPAGFSLDEIKQMSGGKGEPEIDRQMLSDKADELDASIRKLTAMRDGLRHAAVCSAPSHMQCPTFRRLLGLAAAGVIGGDQNKPRPARRHRPG